MTYKIRFTKSYNKRASRFIKRHSDIKQQYEKSLKLLELNPFHPSLRLHRLKGNLKSIYSVSINIQYRIMLHFIIKDDLIIPVDVGSHNEVY